MVICFYFITALHVSYAIDTYIIRFLNVIEYIIIILWRIEL